MYHLCPRKESIRLLLRRHVIRATIDREQVRCLHDCLEEPKRTRISKTWLLVSIPALYTVYATTMMSLVDNENTRFENNVTAAARIDVKDSEIDGVPSLATYGNQLVPPGNSSRRRKPASAYYGDFVWSYIDINMKFYLSKIKHLKEERQNKFTAKPALEITEVPITTTENNTRGSLPICRGNKNFTDAVKLNLSIINGSLGGLFPMVRKGGFYSPPDCYSRHKVAIIVPYRNRKEILKTFLVNIHPFLMAQNLEYQIFIIEQNGNNEFNTGKLMNVGFKLMEKFGSFRCIVQHDVDLLPLSHRILYNCPIYPRLMSSTVVFTNGSLYKVTEKLRGFKGVTSMSIEHYLKVNGFSNLYPEGRYDQDMLLRYRDLRCIRIHAAGLRLTTNMKKVSRYVRLLPPANETATVDSPNKKRQIDTTRRKVDSLLLRTAQARYKSEGLSTLKYQVLNVTYHPLFIHILVNVDTARSLVN